MPKDDTEVKAFEAALLKAKEEQAFEQMGVYLSTEIHIGNGNKGNKKEEGQGASSTDTTLDTDTETKTETENENENDGNDGNDGSINIPPPEASSFYCPIIQSVMTNELTMDNINEDLYWRKEEGDQLTLVLRLLPEEEDDDDSESSPVYYRTFDYNTIRGMFADKDGETPEEEDTAELTALPSLNTNNPLAALNVAATVLFLIERDDDDGDAIILQSVEFHVANINPEGVDDDNVQDQDTNASSTQNEYLMAITNMSSAANKDSFVQSLEKWCLDTSEVAQMALTTLGFQLDPDYRNGVELLEEVESEEPMEEWLDSMFEEDDTMKKELYVVLESLCYIHKRNWETHGAEPMPMPPLVSGLLKQTHRFLKKLVDTTGPSIKLTTGTVSPLFGSLRLGILTFFMLLLKTGYVEVEEQFREHGVLSAALDLFVRYKWNNTIHCIFEQTVYHCLAHSSPEFVVHFFQSTNICARFASVYGESVDAEGQTQQEGGKGKKNAGAGQCGAFGHITRVSNAIVDASNNMEHLHFVREIPEWKSFVEGGLAEMNKRNSTLLGGVKPPTEPMYYDSSDDEQVNSVLSALVAAMNAQNDDDDDSGPIIFDDGDDFDDDDEDEDEFDDLPSLPTPPLGGTEGEKVVVNDEDDFE